MTKRVLITGMHRSGTSLLTSWLRSCGLYVGDDLIGPTPGNPRGHWEDRAFVELFELLLRFNGTDLFDGGGEPLHHTGAQRGLLESLVRERDAAHAEWAVKQPRAALFLDLWLEAAPGTSFIFVLREPAAVVGSLLKRESNKFSYRASERMAPRLREAFLEDQAHFAGRYLRSYVKTYRAILTLMETRTDRRYLLVSFDHLTDVVRDVFERLTGEWELGLHWVDMASLYEPDLVTPRRTLPPVDDGLWAEATGLHQRLLERSRG